MFSRRGTVVGYKGSVAGVRGLWQKRAEEQAGPKTLAQKLKEVEAAAGEKYGGKIVVYTTSVATVQATHLACMEVSFPSWCCTVL